MKSETEKATLAKVSTLDSIFIDYIGNFGKFQKSMVAYITLIVGPLIGFNLTTQLLILLIPPHLCENHAPAIINDTHIQHAHQPDMPRCNLYVHVDEVRFNTTYNFQCPEKREYDHSIVYPTLVSENDWVCTEKWRAMVPHVVFRAGSVFGILAIGVLSDKFGRVPTTIFCFTLAGVAGIATIFSGHNFYAFLICRALVGFVSFKGTIPMILVTEFVGPEERFYVSTGMQMSIGFTNITLPWLAYFLRDWRILAAITSGSMFLVPVASFFTPESVRWLLSRNEPSKTQRAVRILKRIAIMNGKTVPDEALQVIETENKPCESLWSILKYPRFIRLFSLTTLIWVIVAMVSWGGNLYVAILTDHPFVMISINSALDVVATFCSQYLANCFGRRRTVLVSGVFVFVTYFANAFTPTDQKYLFLAMLFLGRLGVTIIYSVKYLYAAELFPTPIRSRAMALRLSIGSIGGLLSPYVLLLDFWGKSSPLVFYGFFSLAAGLLMILLPETNGKTLPETLAEANAFGLEDKNGKKEKKTSIPRSQFPYTINDIKIVNAAFDDIEDMRRDSKEIRKSSTQV